MKIPTFNYKTFIVYYRYRNDEDDYEYRHREVEARSVDDAKGEVIPQVRAELKCGVEFLCAVLKEEVKQ